ncbi:unnamed protein product [Ectocarpus sp. CCAP 1310/34]|nr:unnamed protein product [Ectocarpus sp. CCAP 1310/34]
MGNVNDNATPTGNAFTTQRKEIRKANSPRTVRCPLYPQAEHTVGRNGAKEGSIDRDTRTEESVSVDRAGRKQNHETVALPVIREEVVIGDASASENSLTREDEVAAREEGNFGEVQEGTDRIFAVKSICYFCVRTKE